MQRLKNDVLRALNNPLVVHGGCSFGLLGCSFGVRGISRLDCLVVLFEAAVFHFWIAWLFFWSPRYFTFGLLGGSF